MLSRQYSYEKLCHITIENDENNCINNLFFSYFL